MDVDQKPSTRYSLESFPRSKIEPNVRELLGEKRLYVGKGEDIVLDRLFIADRLREVFPSYLSISKPLLVSNIVRISAISIKAMGLDASTAGQAVATSEIVLFVPSWFLPGFEIWEVPGNP